MEQEITTSSQETHAVAKWFLHTLTIHDKHATVVGFTGQLGAGKTEFIRGLLRTAGINGSVTSPTYTIETVYQLPESQFERAYHIDAYRLEGKEDLYDIGFEDRLEGNDSIILVEWADKVEDALPDHTIWIGFNLQEDKRVITIKNEQGE